MWSRGQLLTLQVLDQFGELVVKEHVLGRGEDRLGLLAGAGVQLMLGDEAQLLHEVLLPNALLNQLLQLISERGGDERKEER